MGRRMRTLVALAAGLVLAGTAWAGEPDPSFSTVPNVLCTPGGTLEYVVNVASSEGPIDSAIVQLDFSTEAAGLMCWCTGQAQPLIEAVTDANGDATFFIAAGGCLDPDSLTTSPVVEVTANGFFIGNAGVVSPDAVDDAGNWPWAPWDPLGNCTTGLSDVTRHTGPIKSGVYHYCSDFDSDGGITISDAVLATGAFSSGDACTQQ